MNNAVRKALLDNIYQAIVYEDHGISIATSNALVAAYNCLMQEEMQEAMYAQFRENVMFMKKKERINEP